jgi:hypothetical protein
MAKQWKQPRHIMLHGGPLDGTVHEAHALPEELVRLFSKDNVVGSCGGMFLPVDEDDPSKGVALYRVREDQRNADFDAVQTHEKVRERFETGDVTDLIGSTLAGRGEVQIFRADGPLDEMIAHIEEVIDKQIERDKPYYERGRDELAAEEDD